MSKSVYKGIISVSCPYYKSTIMLYNAIFRELHMSGVANNIETLSFNSEDSEESVHYILFDCNAVFSLPNLLATERIKSVLVNIAFLDYGVNRATGLFEGRLTINNLIRDLNLNVFFCNTSSEKVSMLYCLGDAGTSSDILLMDKTPELELRHFNKLHYDVGTSQNLYKANIPMKSDKIADELAKIRITASGLHLNSLTDKDSKSLIRDVTQHFSC